MMDFSHYVFSAMTAGKLLKSGSRESSRGVGAAAPSVLRLSVVAEQG